MHLREQIRTQSAGVALSTARGLGLLKTCMLVAHADCPGAHGLPIPPVLTGSQGRRVGAIRACFSSAGLRSASRGSVHLLNVCLLPALRQLLELGKALSRGGILIQWWDIHRASRRPPLLVRWDNHRASRRLPFLVNIRGLPTSPSLPLPPLHSHQLASRLTHDLSLDSHSLPHTDRFSFETTTSGVDDDLAAHCQTVPAVSRPLRNVACCEASCSPRRASSRQRHCLLENFPVATPLAIEGTMRSSRPGAGGASRGDGARALTSPFDIAGAIRYIHAILAALATRMSSVESQFSLVASSLSGLGALQAVVAHDNHRMGRGLAACARAVLIEKLHVCPPKQRANSGGGNLAQTSARVDVVCTLAAMAELLDLNKMVYSAVNYQLPGRQRLKVQVKSFQELAEALSLTPSMEAEVLMRSFRHGDESRVLVEHIKTDAGRVLYILEGRSAMQEVKVATRENEVYDGRQIRFLSTLDVKILKNIDLPELPT